VYVPFSIDGAFPDVHHPCLAPMRPHTIGNAGF